MPKIHTDDFNSKIENLESLSETLNSMATIKMNSQFNGRLFTPVQNENSKGNYLQKREELNTVKKFAEKIIDDLVDLLKSEETAKHPESLRILSKKMTPLKDQFKQAFRGLNQMIEEFQENGGDEISFSTFRKFEKFVTKIEKGIIDKIETLGMVVAETDLKKMNHKDFWDVLEREGTKKLVITCEDGTIITYEKGFLRRLVEIRPDIVDLIEKIILVFQGEKEERIVETKARLRLCGDAFQGIFSVSGDMHEIVMRLLPPKNFKEILKDIENDEFYFKYDSEDLKLAMEFLQYNPLTLPVGVHGQEDWNKYWGDIGEVAPPPQELLEAYKGPCPFTNLKNDPNGPRMADTHEFFWVPPTIDGQILDVATLKKLAESEKFRDNKIGFKHIDETIVHDEKINKPIKKGYWVAVLRQAVFADKQAVFTDKGYNLKKFLSKNYPKYDYPLVRELIISCFMHYVCSGLKKECNLSEENPIWFSICKEEIHREEILNRENPIMLVMACSNSIMVGGFTPSGLRVYERVFVFGRQITQISYGLCPVRRFL